MGVMQMVGGLGLQKSQRTVDLIAKHEIFTISSQCMHAGGYEKRRSMRRDYWVEDRLSKSAHAQKSCSKAT